jgi:hypothetical protein
MWGPRQLPRGLKLDELEYRDRQFAAWIRDRSVELLWANEFASVIHHGFIFEEEVRFVRRGSSIPLRAVELRLECKRSWLAQTVAEDVPKGLYDHLKQVVLIPDKETWSLEFDTRNWREIRLVEEIEAGEPPPGTMRFDMVLYNPLLRNVQGPAPSLDDFIDKTETIVDR